MPPLAAAAAAPSSAVLAPVTSTSATVAPEHKRKYQATNTDHVDKDSTFIAEPSSSKKQKVNDDEKIEHVSSDERTDNVQSKHTSAFTEKTITEKTVEKEFKQISSSKKEHKDNELENDTSNKQNSKDKQPERAASGKPESKDKEPECKDLPDGEFDTPIQKASRLWNHKSRNNSNVRFKTDISIYLGASR